MRYLFLNPPYVIENERVILPTAAMLPVGPLSIATSLAKRGHEVHIVDYVFANSLPTEIDGTGYDAVLIAIHTMRNIPVVRELLTRLRGSVNVLVGGNVCSELGIDDLSRVGVCVDAVIRGYGHGQIEQIEQGARGDIASDAVPNHMLPPDLALMDKATQATYLHFSNARYPIIGPGGFGCAWSCNYCTS